jgi:cobalt-precorrin 5A hydrolase
MKIAMLSLSIQGAKVIAALREQFTDADVFLHADVEGFNDCTRFDRVIELVPTIFHKYKALVFVMPCGVIIRALADLPRDKHSDPAVIMLDVGGRYAVSLLSGHEGGANDLAVRISNAIGAEPVISTTSEAVKNIIAGVGCQRGIPADRLVEAIKGAAQQAGIRIEDIRYIASADIKADEKGLIAAAEELNIPLRFIASDQIRNTRREFTCTKLAQEKVNLPAVSEPAALLAGQRTELILPKTSFNGITVALARENCSSLE